MVGLQPLVGHPADVVGCHGGEDGREFAEEFGPAPLLLQGGGDERPVHEVVDAAEGLGGHGGHHPVDLLLGGGAGTDGRRFLVEGVEQGLDVAAGVVGEQLQHGRVPHVERVSEGAQHPADVGGQLIPFHQSLVQPGGVPSASRSVRTAEAT